MFQRDENRSNPSSGRPSLDWNLPAPYGTKTLLALIVIGALLTVSGRHSEIDKMLAMIGQAVGYSVGASETSQVARGIGQVGSRMFPPRISEITEIARIENFDADNLPLFARIETQDVKSVKVNPATLEREEVVRKREILIDPLGYLKHALWKMLETIEIAVWATIIATLLSIPLAYFSASNYSPSGILYAGARGMVSFLRAIPELISAMFLVLAFGFGPIAGILALGFHSAGFLGKFYAEDIENAEKGPQEALRSIGASKIKTLRFAVLPQVLPQYVAYNTYILDRNVRMATVVGIVGAGGIGQELKGRYDMFDYGHVATILILIFITVFVLDQIAGRIRAKLI